MDISIYFKSVVDSDCAPIVICNLEHKIIYMNPAAIQRYSKRGGSKLIGSSLLDCHNSESNEKIFKVIDWFRGDSSNNRIFTFHNPKENKNVYMVALRSETNELIGYYEKHELRTPEQEKPYDF
ncbi:MAG: PAS domain-containing protein [Ruminococcus sp.]|nr:PAS domain-containing protein [Ruminococcus sp.]